jgi:hypothetical protein
VGQAETLPIATPPVEEAVYGLGKLFEPSESGSTGILASPYFSRRRLETVGRDEFLLDEFPDMPGADSCFARLLPAEARNVRFVVHGSYGIDACPAGGWLLKPATDNAATYWIPRSPVLRKLDPQGHITAEQSVDLAAMAASPAELSVSLQVPADWHLDWVFWRFTPTRAAMAAELGHRVNLERQHFYLWGSKAKVELPAGAYLYLLHGQVYTDAFVWPRKWKFHSELDAHGLYTALDGLQLATGKDFYRLLKRQVLYSVIAQQSPDGGWHQGEWTDLMESHYRLHNAAMLMLEAGLEETHDDVVRSALERAAAFLAQCTDQTDIGTWFLHDSLESSAEAMEEMRRQTRTPWIPSRTLGKSPTNKLILNTHLDAIVTVDRYREVTGDDQYGELIASARAAARAILALRPAESLYRLLYWVIHLTLLPKDEAQRLPLPLRAIKRLTWMYVIPRMHRVKRLFPRLVMPGGLIERHIAPLHYDVIYHPINVLDLIRYGRRFPEEPHTDVIEQAIDVVIARSLLQYWTEHETRHFALVVWADALYQLCCLSPDLAPRRQLADAVLRIEDARLGLPPSLLGCDGEVVARECRQPCPSPANPRLRVVNLSQAGRTEIMVVNPATDPITLVWERMALPPLVWVTSQDQPAHAPSPVIPARSWVLGREVAA